jgi:ferrochelatase
MSLETIKQVYEYNQDETILLPLYPQFSTTTTLSSFNEWKKHFKHHSKLHRICCYYDNKYFISSHIKLLNQVLDILDSNTEVLFSAHGLPQKIIDSGDPYQKQIVSSINLIIQGIRTDITTTVCYQSKVGPMKWLQPSLLDAVKNSTKTNIVIVPIAFVSEHSETLFELDIEAREFIESIGKKYFRIPTLGVQEDYIECLVDLCKKPHKNKMCDICVNNKTLCGMEAYAELKKNSAMR